MPQASIFTIFLFFIYSYGLGFTITSFLKLSENFLERNLMRIGIGLAILPFLGIMLSFFRIPIDWKIILALSMIYPIIHLAKNYKSMKFNPKITTYDIFIVIMFIIFFFTLFMYTKGAFSYPNLEDDDPWSHSIGIKYVSVEKTVFPSKTTAQYLQYIYPYPPAYDLLLGLLHQTSPSINWTMKFFNALIISLSIIFAFFFVKQFTGSKNKALISVFILAMVPAYLSHFIWAIALIVPLYFVGFYCLEKISEDKKWIYPSIFVIASVLTISPSHSAYFGIFTLLYVLTKTILDRKINTPLLTACVLGMLLSFVFWWGIMIKDLGLNQMLSSIGVDAQGVLSVGGTGDRFYTFTDFFTASSANLINSPIGIGQAAVIFAIISVIIIFLRYKKLLQKENQWLVITLVWLALTIYAVNAARFPIKLSAFRVWPLLAIPLSIIIAEGFAYLLSLGKEIEKLFKLEKFFILRGILILLFISLIWFTSGKMKYELNTMAGWYSGAAFPRFQFSDGSVRSPELDAYIWLNTLPINTKVFTFTIDGAVIGMDKYICAWCGDLIAFRKGIINKSGEEIHSWLKQNSFEYAVVGYNEVLEFGANETNTLLQNLVSTNKFIPVYKTETTFVLKVV